MLAARPKTLTGAAVPVMLGCALAASDGDFHLLPAVLCLLFAFLMQIDANLINDLWDYLKGSDGKDRLGPERACAQGWITPRAMRRGIALTTAAACITGCGLLFYGGWWLIAVGALCVVFAFLYTAGPYPLAYHGWGDLLVLAAGDRVPADAQIVEAVLLQADEAMLSGESHPVNKTTLPQDSTQDTFRKDMV